jgi:hypothetical protein
LYCAITFQEVSLLQRVPQAEEHKNSACSWQSSACASHHTLCSSTIVLQHCTAPFERLSQMDLNTVRLVPSQFVSLRFGLTQYQVLGSAIVCSGVMAGWLSEVGLVPIHAWQTLLFNETSREYFTTPLIAFHRLKDSYSVQTFPAQIR